MALRKVAMLTAGGFAPCLSAAVGGLIERYTELAPEVEIIGYRYGYQGLLKGEHFPVTQGVRARARLLHQYGGSPLGNSRVKLTNVKDLVKRGLVAEGADPLKVAADQLAADGIDVLHTIGGDDTNMTGADLAAYLHDHGYELTVVGLPKTIDNDIVPIKHSLGAWTAAEEGAHYFANVVAEHNANPRMLIIHEVMGRNCGWLTAATAADYRKMTREMNFVPELGLSSERRGVHGIYIPEMALDIKGEAARLRKIMDKHDCVNLFISEGAGVESIVAEMKSRGEEVPRDAFGHVRLDKVNVGSWFSKQFAELLGAEKTLVQKSGYYSRAAAANAADRKLIKRCAVKAVQCAFAGKGGVVGEDEERGNVLRAIEFERIKGGKPFDIKTKWFVQLLKEIGQPMGKAVEVKH